MMNTSTQRRDFLKIGGSALAAIPVIALTGNAIAAPNTAMRTALKYQDKPLAEKNCANCLQFVPGASATAKGGCKLMPGDTDIAPAGYCTAWVKKA